MRLHREIVKKWRIICQGVSSKRVSSAGVRVRCVTVFRKGLEQEMRKSFGLYEVST